MECNSVGQRAGDGVFQQGAAEGISIFIASGDGGVAGCASLDSPPQPGEPVSTNILCASPYVTCVGGTEFADSDNPDAYWSRTNGDGYQSALGYIPEGAWNEPLDADGQPQLASTGGGFSSYIATPSWQSFVGNQGRYTPDVSLDASTREGYFTCIAAYGASCATTGGGFTYLNGGGTSASTPSMAGIVALLNQRTGTSQGNMNPRMYSLATNAGAGAFHDVTVASSGVDDCTVATPSLCNNTIPSPTGLAGGLQGYLVKDGYDLATGLGSPDAKNFIANAQSIIDEVKKGKGAIGTLVFDQKAGDDLKASIANLRSVSDKINSGQGTLGKLLSDDSLVRDAQAVMKKADRALDGLDDTGPITAVGVVARGLF